jgi:F-type H+-transporting ATPase subunit delta
LLGDALPDGVRNLVTLMAENGRLTLLTETVNLFSELKAAAEASVTVSVASAFDVSDAELDRISAAMSQRFERTVSISSETDPALIGGAIIRAGDVVIDGSVRGRLDKLAGTLAS